MKIVTQRELTRENIREAAEPLRSDFDADWTRRVTAMRLAISQLDPETAEQSDIAAIRTANGFQGAGSVLCCGECGQEVGSVIRFGAEELGYSEDVCLRCVEEAARIMRAHLGPNGERCR